VRARAIIGMFPAIGFSLIPGITCPACLPALASLLGAIGLTFIAQHDYLVWLNLAALLIAILFLARSERTWISWPLVVAIIGATAIMLGKFVWSSSMMWWAGLGVFLLGSARSSWNRRSSVKVCSECKSLKMEN
jgi:mercuric ion transport protein